ncbi:hypothetical protein [Sphaerisporangium aureirubrum]|uniref:Uncharacterized protein n=1 Tax=Sphaerisporangium aureirubrum TaxID=1544736 RepID=A0ABW1NNC5_9ACTN
MPCVPRIRDLPAGPDAVVVATPATTVPGPGGGGGPGDVTAVDAVIVRAGA